MKSFLYKSFVITKIIFPSFNRSFLRLKRTQVIFQYLPKSIRVCNYEKMNVFVTGQQCANKINIERLSHIEVLMLAKQI